MVCLRRLVLRTVLVLFQRVLTLTHYPPVTGFSYCVSCIRTPTTLLVSVRASPPRPCLLIIRTVQGTTPVHQYDPTAVIDSFSTLKLDEAIPPESDSPPQYTDPAPRAGTSMLTQPGRRGPSLPLSPSQGLPGRSPPPQDPIYLNPPYDDTASYHSGYESLPNGDQSGVHVTHQHWNESTAYPSASYGVTDHPSQYHQPPHSQAYLQQRKHPKEILVRPF